MSEITVVRHFALEKNGNPTVVVIAELSSGNIWMSLQTKRDGIDSLVTEMVFTPGTFNLVTSALFRAAHDSTIWDEIKKDEVSE